MDRFTQLAVAASQEAMRDSNLVIDDSNRDDISVMVGSGIGGLGTLSEQLKILNEKGPDRVSPFLIPMMISDMAGAQISIDIGAKGANVCSTSACSSGTDAIGNAYEILKRGDGVAIITGGAEAVVTPIGVAGFNAARTLSTRNDDPSMLPGRSIRHAMVLLSVKALRYWFWKPWILPKNAARTFWRKSSATAPAAMLIILLLRLTPARAPSGR